MTKTIIPSWTKRSSTHQIWFMHVCNISRLIPTTETFKRASETSVEDASAQAARLSPRRPDAEQSTSGSAPIQNRTMEGMEQEDAFERSPGGTPEVDTIVQVFRNGAAKDLNGNKFKQFLTESLRRCASKSACPGRTVFVSCKSGSIR